MTLSLVLTLAVGVGTGQVFAQAPVCDFWGMSTTFHGRPITTADTIKAYDPDGVLCGVQYAWGGPGQYGIHVEGDLPFTPDKDEGAVDGDTITFYINGEKATVVSGSPVWSPGGYFQLELSVPGPDIAVSTDSVDFGGVQVGSSKDTVLTVSNEGTSPLTINDIVSSNPSVFEVIYTPGFPAIVDVAANIDVTVSFRPADVTTYTDSLTVISDDPDEGTLYVSLTGKGMPAPLVVTTASLADGVVGESYNQTLGASGGVKPYTWGMASGSLPEGLNLDSSGRISGVPSTHGTFSFRVEVTDSLGTKATKDLSITVAPAPLVVTTASLADGVVGESYNQTLGASGGVKPYTWGMASGNLPGGLSLDSSGRISGVPSTHGTFSFRVEVTDSLGTKATRDLSITIRGPEINITPERVDFVEVPVGMYRDTTLTISNNGSGILTVDSIVPGDTVVFKVEYASGFPVALDPKDTIEVIIRFCPDSSSAYVDSLKIASNDPDDPLLCVLLTGRGTGLPEIAISSESIDFGVVPVGTFRDSVLKVCNKGTADLRIDDMVLGSSEAFSWIYEPGFPDVLAPGDTIEVTLRFGPEAATVHSDTLRIYSNDPDDPVVSASLEGRGTEVYIALPDTTASPGDTLDVPVLVSDLTGLGITGVGLRITYDAEKLTALGASTGGTIAEGWGTPTYNITDGRMNIGMAGATSLAGSGPLVYIKFAVASDLSLGVTSPLDLAEVELNDGEIPASVQGGSVVVVVTKFDISGKIGYYADTTKAIEGVSVTAFEGGVPVCSDTTDEDGRYELPDLPVGDYTVRPVKEARGRESAVSPLDAAKVLQYYVGLVDLSPYQRIAGDVTGNRQVGPFDAAKILQYYVGLIDSFPAGSWKFVPTSFTLNGTSWSSAPDNLVYEPLDSDKSDQDYVGVLYGDVTGNWSGSTSPKVAVGGVRHVSLSSVSEGVGVFTLLVEVDDATGVLSVGITLNYDPEELRVEEVGPGDLTFDYFIAYRISDGKLKIGLAGSRELSGSGSLVKVRFRVLKDLGIPVTISEVQLNEGEIPVMIMPTMVEDLAPPEEFALSQNYPNPFNSETNISYQLPAESDVRLEIYNLAGQLVRTLVSDRQEAGSYTVRWDGEGRVRQGGGRWDILL